MPKKLSVISASDIGKAAFCPHALSLDKQGSEVGAEYARSMRAGTAKHDDLTQQVLAAQDKRCFVATHAFGPEHPVTCSLRQWRDEVLVPTWWGRVLVRLYYACSPYLVRLCLALPWIDKPLRGLLVRIARVTRP